MLFCLHFANFWTADVTVLYQFKKKWEFEFSNKTVPFDGLYGETRKTILYKKLKFNFPAMALKFFGGFIRKIRL